MLKFGDLLHFFDISDNYKHKTDTSGVVKPGNRLDKVLNEPKIKIVAAQRLCLQQNLIIFI